MTDYSKLSREALIEELQQLQRHSQQAEDQGRAAQLAEELRVHQVELEMQNRELRESQQLLEEARVRYADLYDFAPVGYLIVDQRGRIDEINLTAASMLDQPRANLIGLPLTGWLRSPDIKRFFDFLRALGGAGRLTVSGLQLVTRASPNRHLRLKGTTIENGEEAPPRFRIALIDITTSHNAEQALRGSERRYRSLFDDSPLPLWEVDLFAVRDLLAGLPEPQSMSLGDVPRRDRPIIHQCIRRMRIVDVNQAALELVAMPRKDHLLQGIAALLTARSWRALAKAFGLLWRGGSQFVIETSLRCCDGAVRDVIMHVHVAPDHGHTLGRIVVAMVDITQRLAAERALRVSEQRFRALLEQSPVSTVLYAPDGTFKEANPACLSRWGVTVEQLRNYNILEDLQLQALGILPTLRRGFGGEAVTTPEFEYDADARFGAVGRKWWARLHIHPIRMGGDIVEIVVQDQDMTRERLAREEARRRQNELAHVARLTTLGEMATSLAHEVNQPLMAISNYAEACLEMTAAGAADAPTLRGALRDIAGQANRAGEIIRRIRSFVRREPPQRKRTSINFLIEEVLQFLTSDIDRAGLRLCYELSAELPPVAVDDVQIEQVILNIVHNALEAMRENPPARRILTIRTLRQPGGKVRAEFVDTGPGIAAESLPQIFEPFFSTKEHGIGMGLAISRSIIEAHGGRLTVASVPGEGTTLSFDLPLNGNRAPIR